MSERPDDALIDAAELGQQAKEFLESNLGVNILAQLEQDEQEAVNALARVNPTDTAKIVQWQVSLQAARKCREKLNWFITVGDNAKQAWKAGQNEP